MKGSNATLALAEFISSGGKSMITPSDLDAARLSLIDTVCAAAVGRGGGIAAKVIGAQESGPTVQGVRVAGTDLEMTPVRAAFAFGCFAHADELDDWALYGAGGAPVWGALLALHQLEKRNSLDDLLAAFCVGVHAALAMWRAGRYRQGDRGMDGTSTFGAIASMAACTHFLGADVETARCAIGICASSLSGVVANLGTDIATIHAGIAARSGLQSALLGQAGLYGSTNVLEARQGLGETLFGVQGHQMSGLADALEDGTGVASALRFKEAACVIEHQRVIKVVGRLLRGAGGDGAVVMNVRVTGVPPTSEGVRADVPHTDAEARTSMRYSIARVLTYGRLTPRQLDADLFMSEPVVAALEKVRVDVAPRWDPRLPSSEDECALIELHLANGDVLSGHVADEPLSASLELVRGKWDRLAQEPDRGDVPWLANVVTAWSECGGEPIPASALAIPGL